MYITPDLRLFAKSLTPMKSHYGISLVSIGGGLAIFSAREYQRLAATDISPRYLQSVLAAQEGHWRMLVSLWAVTGTKGGDRRLKRGYGHMVSSAPPMAQQQFLSHMWGNIEAWVVKVMVRLASDPHRYFKQLKHQAFWFRCLWCASSIDNGALRRALGYFYPKVLARRFLSKTPTTGDWRFYQISMCGRALPKPYVPTVEESSLNKLKKLITERPLVDSSGFDWIENDLADLINHSSEKGMLGKYEPVLFSVGSCLEAPRSTGGYTASLQSTFVPRSDPKGPIVSGVDPDFDEYVEIMNRPLPVFGLEGRLRTLMDTEHFMFVEPSLKRVGGIAWDTERYSSQGGLLRKEETARQHVRERWAASAVLPVLEYGWKVRFVTKSPAELVRLGHAVRNRYYPLLLHPRMPETRDGLATDRCTGFVVRFEKGRRVFSADFSNATDTIYVEVLDRVAKVLGVGINVLYGHAVNFRPKDHCCDVRYDRHHMYSGISVTCKSGEDHLFSTQRGLYMGLPSSWTILSLIHFLIAKKVDDMTPQRSVVISKKTKKQRFRRRRLFRIRGDDLISYWTLLQIAEYRKICNSVGLILNEDKTLESQYRGTFCEEPWCLTELDGCLTPHKSPEPGRYEPHYADVHELVVHEHHAQAEKPVSKRDKARPVLGRVGRLYRLAPALCSVPLRVLNKDISTWKHGENAWQTSLGMFPSQLDIGSSLWSCRGNVPMKGFNQFVRICASKYIKFGRNIGLDAYLPPLFGGLGLPPPRPSATVVRQSDKVLLTHCHNGARGLSSLMLTASAATPLQKEIARWLRPLLDDIMWYPSGSTNIPLLPRWKEEVSLLARDVGTVGFVGGLSNAPRKKGIGFFSVMKRIRHLIGLRKRMLREGHVPALNWRYTGAYDLVKRLQPSRSQFFTKLRGLSNTTIWDSSAIHGVVLHDDPEWIDLVWVIGSRFEFNELRTENPEAAVAVRPILDPSPRPEGFAPALWWMMLCGHI
jgi:hypothetical protein